jgi:hypothetical protein
MDLLTTWSHTLQITGIHKLVSSVYDSLHKPFPGNGFNNGTVTVSLNYTLQISHIKSSFHSHTLAVNSPSFVSLLRKGAVVQSILNFKLMKSKLVRFHCISNISNIKVITATTL